MIRIMISIIFITVKPRRLLIRLYYLLLIRKYYRKQIVWFLYLAYLFSFEGLILKYDYREKKIKAEKNIKNILAKDEQYGDYVANPAFLSKVLFDEQNIYMALLNGMILTLRKNLKKKNLKTVHNNMIIDFKLCNFEDMLLSIGKDKKIKIIDKENLNIKYYIEEEAEFIESDKNNNIIYIDKSNILKLIKL